MAALLLTSVAWANDARAQGSQVVEDEDVGVRFTIPKDWEWRSRQRDIFVNCAPKIESRPGMPGCYFTVQKHRITQGQTAITDADRAKWKSWTLADGMRPFVSARDLKVAGFPAHEVVARQGKERGAATGPRVFVLIPQHGVIDAWLYAHWKDEDQTPRMEPAFRSAMETLRRTK
jgi:hypothetical protein